MSCIQACLFDLDGVIVDTAKYHYLAWKQLANELGFSFTEEDNEKLKGVSRMDSLEILLKIGNIQVSAQEKIILAEKKNRWYVHSISKMDPSEILPGVKTFIEMLRAQGIKIGLGSASKNTPIILKNIGMEEYFDSIVDGNRITKAKPDPEVFLLGSKELNISPQNCVVFEDSKAGIEAAKACGMYVIGVGTHTALKEADKVISSFEGLTLDILQF